MSSNTIALIWDFDNTLIKGCMQDPIFDAYHVNAELFWKQKEELGKFYRRQGLRVNMDTLYLNLFLQKVKNGELAGLNNQKLTSFGLKQHFCPGIPAFFSTIRQWIEQHPIYVMHDIHLEHYIVSNGMAAIIRGCALASETAAIWGCEYADTCGENALLDEIIYTVDHTAKTRILFEINKGLNRDVNARIPPNEKRIPFSNMIYIADGQSDIPAFSLITERGGTAFGVYHRDQPYTLLQVKQLYSDGRLSAFVEADYSPSSPAFELIKAKVSQIADNLCSTRDS